MAARGDGPMAVTVMTVLTAILLVFSVLRIYTRKFVVNSYGLDDHVYLLAFFLFLFYTIFIGVAAHYGFGQNMWEIDPPRNITLAVLYECIAQTFAVIASCVLTDLFFAIMPWVFIWKLQMNRRERLIILASMSLGIIAAACGIKRATEIPKLMSDNYLKDSTGIIVWSAAEMAVTMICIGIPVCRPLYKNYISRLTSGGASSRYKDLSGRAENPAG
ncbi:hypothetical protein CDV36_014978, partial [Fusarium kuroshium]